MKFYVILSLDVADKNCYPKLESYLPSKDVLKHLTKTEGNECADYEYLGPAWEGHSHVKYAGLLTREQFDQLMSETSFVYEDCETMGSLTDLGWLPAVAYNWDDMVYTNIIGSMYVTPLPEVNEPMSAWHPDEIEALPKDFKDLLKEELQERADRNWQRIRSAMKSVYPY